MEDEAQGTMRPRGTPGSQASLPSDPSPAQGGWRPCLPQSAECARWGRAGLQGRALSVGPIPQRKPAQGPWLAGTVPPPLSGSLPSFSPTPRWPKESPGRSNSALPDEPRQGTSECGSPLDKHPHLPFPSRVCLLFHRSSSPSLSSLPRLGETFISVP